MSDDFRVQTRKSLVLDAESRCKKYKYSKNHFRKGDVALVTDVPGTDPNPLRLTPQKKGRKVGTIPEGKTATLLYGPHCSGGIVWWVVITPSGQVGWTGEWENGDYLLERAD